MQGSLKRRVLAGGSWVLFGRVITALSTMAINAMLSRLLTQSAFGVYLMAFSLVAVASLVAQLGLSSTVVRLVAESLGLGNPGRARAAVEIAYRYAALGVVAVAAFLLLGGGSWLALGLWDSELLAASLGSVAAWVAVLSFQTLTSETFRSFQDLRLASVFGGVITSLLMIASLGVVSLTEGEASFAQVIVIYMLCGAVSLTVAASFVYRKVVRLGPRQALATREVFAISGPLWINALMVFGLQRSDIWILGATRSAEEVAIYGAAAVLVSLISQTMILVNLIVPPIIAELYALGEKQRLQRVLRNTATVAGLPALAVIIPFVFFGSPVLGLIYPDEYRAGAAVLAVLSVAKLFDVWTGSASFVLSMTGFHAVLMRITIVSSLATIGVAVAVVGRYGGIGVALAIGGGVCVQALWVWISARYYTGIWTHFGIPSVEDVRSLFSRGT